MPAEAFGSTGRDLVLAVAPAARRASSRPATWKGHELVGLHYARPFTLLDPPAGATDAWRIVAADYVSTDDGTGIVHQAPAFGEEDAAVARAEGLPMLNPVDADGTFDSSVPQWQGLFVKDADRGIIADLAERGLLVRELPYTHSYPHCWRCGTPLIYWAKTSWFVRTSTMRDELLARERDHQLAARPHQARPVRQVARGQRRLGVVPRPLLGHAPADLALPGLWPRPLRRIGGRAVRALRARSQPSSTCTVPTSTRSRWPAPSAAACPGGSPPVLDAWFDSGSMPSAQAHYPFGDEDAFHHSFPADFICEAIDQTRGWFYSLLAVNTLVFDRSPYRNVVCLNLIVDENGQKMSKSRGNIIAPWDIFSDPGRRRAALVLLLVGPAVDPAARVYPDGIRESTRQTLLTLWNVFSFFATYADLDGWSPGDGPRPSPATCSTGGSSGSSTTPSTSSPTRSRASTRWPVPPAWPPSSTTCRTGTCAGPDPASGRAAMPAAHATLHECLVTTAAAAGAVLPLPGRRHLRAAHRRAGGAPERLAGRARARPDADAGRPRSRRPVGSSPSGGRPAPTPRSGCANRCRRALVLHPGIDARRRRSTTRSAPSSTSRRSNASTRCRA